LVKRGFTQHHKSAAQYLYFVGLVGVKKAQVVAAKRRRLWEQASQPKYLVERHLGGREAALAFGQEAPLPIKHFHA
jgi:hypothetical protein